MIASYLRKRESGGVRGFRPRPAGRVLRARGGPARRGAAGGRRQRRARRSARACCRSCARRSASRCDPAMLTGRRAAATTDGPWAPHWYQAVEASTGFGPPETAPVDLPDEARRLADRCRPYYERLAAHRIRPGRHDGRVQLSLGPAFHHARPGDCAGPSGLSSQFSLRKDGCGIPPGADLERTVLAFVAQAWWASFGLRERTHWDFLAFAIILLQMVPALHVTALIFPDIPASGRRGPGRPFGTTPRGIFRLRARDARSQPLEEHRSRSSPAVEGRQSCFHLLLALIAVVGIVIRSARIQLLIAGSAAILIAYVSLLFAHI